jgi:GTP-binding protein EngB required for normal cell division
VAREEKRKQIIASLKEKYTNSGNYRLTEANQRNIMIIGRSRTGKSTIKSLLVDPTVVPDQMTLKSGTRDPDFKSFYIDDNKIVLNIIDTPGLFERSDSKLDIRDNDTILKTIEMCINREITKFHVICFCVAITVGINEQDMQSLTMLAEFLGPQVQSNSCLIVTRCETKDEDQLAELDRELRKDTFFQKIVSYFGLGIYFSGSLNPDDYNKANRDSLEDQFETICNYRTKLLQLFTSDIVPYPISEMMISEIQHARNEEAMVKVELHETQAALRAQQLQKLQSKSRCNTS